MKLSFYGGTGSVTGANYLLEVGDPVSAKAPTAKQKILIDCGLHQGSYYAERENFEPFPYKPSEIDAVFITHAHLDHIGRLPKLLKDGFRGKIFSTPPTADFAELMLLDSEHILQKEAERERKPPLYSASDINNLMSIWQKVDYHQPLKFGNLEITFFYAGHILGSAFIRVKAEGKTIIFSGDLGNSPAPIIKPREEPPQADYCLIESTYGDRLHQNSDKCREILEDVIENTVRAGGVLLIPAFALERTQELLFHLHQLFEEGRVPRVPVFIDSPLAIKLTAVYKKYENYFREDVLREKRAGDDILNFPGLRLTLTTEQSKEINNVPAPKIVIAGSGMSHGGRILHHELRYLPDPKSTILFVGYQTKNSLGRRILQGAEKVKIFGEEISIRCKKVQITGYSAHADQKQLLEWLNPMRATLREVFVVQGEEGASEIFAQKIRDELAVEAVAPESRSQFVL